MGTNICNDIISYSDSEVIVNANIYVKVPAPHDYGRYNSAYSYYMGDFILIPKGTYEMYSVGSSIASPYFGLKLIPYWQYNSDEYLMCVAHIEIYNDLAVFSGRPCVALTQFTHSSDSTDYFVKSTLNYPPASGGSYSDTVFFSPSAEVMLPSMSNKGECVFTLFTDDPSYAISGYDWSCEWTPLTVSSSKVTISGVNGTTPSLKSIKIYCSDWSEPFILNTTQPNFSFDIADYNLGEFESYGLMLVVFCDEENGLGNEFMELIVGYNLV